MQSALTIKQLRSAVAGPFELRLATGGCAAITGPSGSGKSLFLRMIADLDPNEGEVWLNATRTRAPCRRRNGASTSPTSPPNPGGGPTS